MAAGLSESRCLVVDPRIKSAARSQFNALSGWAKSNLSQDELASYNAVCRLRQQGRNYLGIEGNAGTTGLKRLLSLNHSSTGAEHQQTTTMQV